MLDILNKEGDYARDWKPISMAPHRDYVTVLIQYDDGSWRNARGYFGKVDINLPEQWFDDDCKPFNPQPLYFKEQTPPPKE